MIRIFLIDESAELKNQMEEFFRFEHDMEVVGSASNGREALAKLQSIRPDVILLSSVLPELDGVAVAQEVQKLFQSELPVMIMYSSFNIDAVMSQAVKAGVVYCFQKPFSMQIMAERIRGIVVGNEEPVQTHNSAERL